MAMLDYFVEQEEITDLILAPSLPSRAFVRVFSVMGGVSVARGKWNVVVLELNEARAIWKRRLFFKHAKHSPCLRLDRVCFVRSTHEFCRYRGDLCVAQRSLHQNVLRWIIFPIIVPNYMQPPTTLGNIPQLL